MIIKGASRAGARELGIYLSTPGENEHVETLEIRGTVAKDVRGALAEMAGHAAGTRCAKHLYHAMINPDPTKPLTREQCIAAVDALGEELGFGDNARVIVLHQKEGRQHLHIAWSRINVHTMKAVHMSKSFAKHEKVARELERQLGHDKVQGVHQERDGKKRPNRSPTRSELRQQEKTGIKGSDVRNEITSIFQQSKSAEDFRAAVDGRGYVLALGDRRDYVILDRRGGTHSLARRIEGANAKQLREFMKPIDPKTVPTVKQAKAIVGQRLSELAEAGGLDWEDKLRIEALKKFDVEQELAKKRKPGQQEATTAAKREKQYSEGQDYVTQSEAALQDHIKRQPKDRLKPQHPADHVSPPVQRQFAEAASNVTKVADPNETERVRKERREKAMARLDKLRRLAAGRREANKPIAKAQHAKLDPAQGGVDRRFREVSARPADPARIVSALRESTRPNDSEHKPAFIDRPIDGRDNPFREVEMDDRLSERLSRRLAEEKWSDRDPNDQSHSRQREAPGRGRTRSR